MNFRHLFCAVTLIGSFAVPCLYGQVGNYNPSGPTGVFNGNITTAGSYDPYTGNATRSVTDIVVAGGVGSYPLAFSRVANSRQDGSYDFGVAGGWRHSYSWSMTTPADLLTPQPTSYEVGFPDGREEGFSSTGNRTAPGIRERVQPIDFATMLAYVLLPDGGKVEFKATQHSQIDTEFNRTEYWYDFQLKALIDPYGLRTSFNYNGNGELNTIVEPAGRWIQLVYVTTPWFNGLGTQDRVLDHVTASDGRTVQYNYELHAFAPDTIAYTHLVTVVYYGDTGVKATYTYQAGNTPSGGYYGKPLLASCRDPMYDGPMKYISYAYATGVNGDSTSVVHGQIRSENSVTTGQSVSTLQILTSGHNEAKADGSTRNFKYDNNGQLTSWSDFVNIFRYSNKEYDANGFIKTVTDPNVNKTTFSCDPITGNITSITYPLTAGDTTPATVQYVYGGPNCPDGNNRTNGYYLYSATDERNSTTIILRDASKRPSQVNYPDGGYDGFAYNSLGQVSRHRLQAQGTSGIGGLETFTYDTTGKKLSHRDPYHQSVVDGSHPEVPTAANPTAWFGYNSLGRLSAVTDMRGSALNDPNYTTNYAYNARGQTTLVTLPTDPGDGQRPTVQAFYNADGTLEHSTNELGLSTGYTYDDYKRLLTSTPPPQTTGDTLNHTTYLYYDSTGGTAMDYSHTDAYVRRSVSPPAAAYGGVVNVVSTFTYNANLWKVAASTGTGTELATTTYSYDYAGNLKTIKDPNGQTTGLFAEYFYDERNRPANFDDAMLNDTATPHRNINGHTTSWAYDKAGNKTRERRANNELITYDAYDAMNRLTMQTERRDGNTANDVVTHWTWGRLGTLLTMADPRGQTYGYTSDLLGRKIDVQYPSADGSLASTHEHFEYDSANNLGQFTNRATTIQTFTYDNRNRQTGFSWNDGATPSQAVSYDAASRIVQIANSNATIKRSYFDDNSLRKEEEWTAEENIHRTVSYSYDATGNRSAIGYPSGSSFDYGYTGRNQLWYVRDSAINIFQSAYEYDLSGRIKTRQVGNSWIKTAATQRDPLGHATHLEHQFGPSGVKTFDYSYDVMGNRSSATRNGTATDSFSYDLTEQAISTTIDGASATFAYDGNGNRTGTGYAVNNLSQYASFGGSAVSYGPKGNLTSYDGWTYTYDAQSRLTGASNGTYSAYYWYDGLNRQIKRTINGTTLYNVWDGWNLIEEWSPGNVLHNSFLYGAGEIVERINTKTFYFQDSLGSTSHVSDEAGNVLESYTYSRTGQPSYYNANGSSIGASAQNVRHLFQGQLWTPTIGLNDYRNRVQHPKLGIFMQVDPIGFAGDSSNLYRFCGNNPVNRTDPSGLGPVGIPPARQDAMNRGMSSEDRTHHLDLVGVMPSWIIGSSGDNGWGIYVPGEGHLGINFGGGVVYGGPGNSSGLSLYGKPVLRAAAAEPSGSKSDLSIGLVVVDGEVINLTDPEVIAALESVYEKRIAGKDVRGMSDREYSGFMGALDTDRFHSNPNGVFSYHGSLGPDAGNYYGSAVNYVGVGAGFAARGLSSLGMNLQIAGYRLWNYGFFRGGEFAWGRVGYDWYMKTHPGG